MRMIRKQVYLSPEHDRRLKAVAAIRGCTEAAVIREAIQQLPDPEGSFVEQLATAGLLAPKRVFPDLPDTAAAAELERELDQWLAGRHEPLGLGEAVLQERAQP